MVTLPSWRMQKVILAIQNSYVYCYLLTGNTSSRGNSPEGRAGFHERYSLISSKSITSKLGQLIYLKEEDTFSI